MCQVPYRDRKLATEYPSLDSSLPSDLKPGQQSQPPHSDCNAPVLSAIRASNVSGFGRHAQAVYLLDQILHVLSFPAEVETMHLELERLDGEIQAFLMLLLDESSQMRLHHCGAIASTIRYDSFELQHAGRGLPAADLANEGAGHFSFCIRPL